MLSILRRTTEADDKGQHSSGKETVMGLASQENVAISIPGKPTHPLSSLEIQATLGAQRKFIKDSE